MLRFQPTFSFALPPLGPALPALLLLGLLLGAWNTSRAQAPETPPTAASTADADPAAVSAKAHATLDAGLKTTGLTAPGAKPWHLKASYQVLDHGVPTDSGTIEEWWTSSDQWRRTYTTRTDTWTEWSVTPGQHMQSKAGFQYLSLDRRVAGPLVAPLAQAKYFKPEYPMGWRQVKAGIPLDCVMVLHPAQYSDGIDPEYLFPTLCFDGDARLRFMGTSDTTVTLNKYQAFQDRAVAYKVDVIVQGDKKASIDVTLLEPLADEAMVKPDPSAVPQPYAITASDPRPVPVYQVSADTPSAALENGERGDVTVPVIIRTDGRVKLNGSATGNGMLAQAAVDAIKTWRYQPYLVDGQPVEAAYSVVYKFDGRPFVSEVGKPKGPSNSGYDPRRDPIDDLKQAIAQAAQSHKRILIEVGGDWCIWCGYLDKFFADHHDLDALRQSSYITVKVNMSDENHNNAFLMQYPKIAAYPHIFVLDGDGKLLQSQDTGELEKGNSYSPDKVRDFLTKWKPS